jgi:hypothetical protein
MTYFTVLRQAYPITTHIPMKTHCLLTLGFVCVFCQVFGQKMQPYSFVENKGQILTQDGSPSPALFLYSAQRGLKVQIHARGFSYDAHQSTGDTTIIDQRSKEVHKLPKSYHYHRVDVNALKITWCTIPIRILMA